MKDTDLQSDSDLARGTGSVHLTASRPDLQIDKDSAPNQVEGELKLAAASRIPRVLLTRLQTGLDGRDSDDDLSDSSAYSVMSLESGGSNTGIDKPRKRKPDDDGVPDLSKKAALTRKKGRSWSPIPGLYIGLAKAQVTYKKAKEEALRFQAKRDVVEIVKRAQERRESKSVSPVPAPIRKEDTSDQTSAALTNGVEALFLSHTLGRYEVEKPQGDLHAMPKRGGSQYKGGRIGNDRAQHVR
ncbi:hypothetical protein KGM_205307 [Danaus plexippus plexippus]|uniref:Uncharacterized protein n=1 Tax=Danaus plexippus plexippus TaxID=278856 RepID=A0A212FC15_DANPL|nr:hypothetical protein KGM_205307 [Danaus plexippus plexippus]